MSMVAAGVAVAGAVIGGIMSANAAAAAGREKARLQAKLDSLERSRQAIINPYENIKDLSSMAKDLSGMITNPYANLGVATQAAKFEAEQIDMSLANTLDTLRETGSSAGGATALAQAALKSKQGISANIEQQEAQNEKLKAEGKQQMDMLKMQEATRIQGIQISEGQRVQGAEAQGKAFVFGAKEDRENAAIDRVAGQLGIAGQQQAQANADTTGAITSGIGALGAVGGAMASRTASPTTTQQRKTAESLSGSLTKTNVELDKPLNVLGQLPAPDVYGSAGNVNNYESDQYDEVMTPYPG